MSQASSREVLKQRVVRFFCARLPVRMKRLVHGASLGAYIKGATSLDDATISKLNAVMALGSSDSALKLPVLLSRAIWDGRVQTPEFNLDVPLASSPEIVAQMTVIYTQATPKWLRYGEDGIIRGDVEKLLSMFKTHSDVHTAA